MAHFLRLTLSGTEEPRLINFDNVREVGINENNVTTIYFTETDCTTVEETFDDIAGWLMDSAEPVDPVDDYRAAMGMPDSED